jgi:hypothetical protein
LRIPLEHSAGRLLTEWTQMRSPEQRSKSIEVLPGGKNLETAIGFDTKKNVLSREDDLGVRLHGALKHHVILWIAAHLHPRFLLFQHAFRRWCIPSRCENFRNDSFANRDGAFEC